MPDKPNLDAAYALETPDDNRRLYGAWADSYDAGFAQAKGYQLPGHVARCFAELGGLGPVLDLGAGTGLLAQALREISDVEIDALDLSAQMLAVAGAKGVYRALIEANLNAPLALPKGRYGGVVSSGTFTHGHVGPDALDGVLALAKPGALFVLSVNAAHFEARGFAAKFETLAPKITDFQIRTVKIYDAKAKPEARDEHSETPGHLAIFRRV